MGIWIDSVRALDDLMIEAVFEDGAVYRYDVHPLIDQYPDFGRLRDEPALFSRVRTIGRGGGVIWDDDLDLAAEEIRENGIRMYQK